MAVTQLDFDAELETLSCRNQKLRRLCRCQSGLIKTLYAEVDRLRGELVKEKGEKRLLRQRLGMYSAKYGDKEDAICPVER